MLAVDAARADPRRPRSQGSINLKGAQIDDLLLVRQRQTIAKNSPPVRLLSPLGAPGAYVAAVRLDRPGRGRRRTSTPSGRPTAPVLTPGQPVTLTTQTPDGVRYQIKIAVDDGYLFTVEQRVDQRPAQAARRPPDRPRQPRDASRPTRRRWTNHVGPIGVFDGKADYDVNWKDLDEEGQQGLRQRQRLARLHRQILADRAGRRQRGNDAPTSADRRAAATRPTMRWRRSIVAPGQTLTTQTRLFAGAKEKRWLDRYEDAGIPKLSKSIDWGWFEWFMRPIFDLLLFLFHTIGNFGVAIICLTLIVRAIMFPIAQKQFQSMAAMRKVQPKMKAIQERFKDDKPRQQQEILKLYQAEKINPAAGCLPILLQIPVFYALYKVLLVSVEMRHQPFVAVDQGSVRARPADPGQPVRPAATSRRRIPRDRRAADPGRRRRSGCR